MKSPKKNPGKSRRYSRGLLALASMAATTGLLAQAAPTPAPTPTAATEPEGEVVELTPFEVSGQKDEGYIATETLAGTRIRSELRDLGSAISVVTKTMMDDIGATDATTLLQYTTNTEVAGTRGTFSGLNGQNDEGNTLRNPSQAQRVRGLTSADNTRDYFVTDIPWDSYNTDRIDILRGPNSFLFGLGSPAGIQNGSLQNASFKNEGQLSHRIGSYGSQRLSLNVNQALIKDVLALRVAGLGDHENFRAHPAYEDDERIYAALRFDPKLIKADGFKTSIKIKYEAGDIDANRQRNMTPIDNLTAWFRPVDNTSAAGGMGKLTIKTPYQARRTTDDSLENGYGAIDSSSMNYSPWLSDTVNAQQPYWTMNGDTGATYGVYGGWINAGAYGSNGKLTGTSDGVPNRWNSGNIYRIKGYGDRATDGKYPLPLSQYGGYRNQSLTDSSIFDFYHTLIDGDNKSEFQRWTAYNIDVSQTGWNDRVALNLIYDRQRNKTGGESLLGWAPGITIDITENLDEYYLTSDGSGITNPNFGRPFVTGAGDGGGTGSWTYTDREYMRASLLAELRTSDLTDNKFLIKLLGKHRFNGVASKDDYFSEYRAWRMYANNQAWAGYWNGNTGATSPFTDRSPTAIIYLGDSIANLSSASGAYIPGINSHIELQDSPIRVFDPTPTVDLSVYANPWTIPAGSVLLDVFNPNNTSRPLRQESNPANMVGWTNYTQDALMRGNGGENTDMLTSAEMTKKATTSFAGTYQGFFWNDAFIPTLGWRYDKVKTKGVRAKVQPSKRNMLNMAEDAYVMPEEYGDAETVTGHSLNWGGVLHLNRLLKNDPLPINISLSYMKSDNFQVTAVRRDLYGTPLDNPSGETKEYGITLSTKDNKYSFRATKFETSMKGVNAGLSNTNIGGILSNGLNWRNVFLYELGAYDFATRANPSYRNRWTNAYPKYIQDASGNNYTEGSAEYVAGMAAATARMDEAIRGWNEIQKYLDSKGFFQAWNFTPLGPDTALVDRTTYLSDTTKYAPTVNTVYSYAPSAPQGFTVLADTVSKGYEFEFIANPTANWRISFNAAKTDASINNVGGESLTEFVQYMQSKMYNSDGTLTAAGEVPRWGGAGSCIGATVWAPWYAAYQKMKLKEGTTADEVRKWRFNVITNYSFREGFLKGTGVGAAYRWQDKVVLGYPMTSDGLYDLGKPFYGPTEGSMDAWLSYERKLTQKINWKIQLNVRNIFAKNELIPIYIQPDGQTWATARVAPAREWSITNTFSY